MEIGRGESLQARSRTANKDLRALAANSLEQP